MIDQIEAYLAADVPVLLWGAPGTGKTAAIMALASRRDAHAEVLIGSQIDPVDVGGYLVPDKAGKIRCSPPPWVTAIRSALDAGRDAWLVLDELSCAPYSVQAALLRVVHDRHAAGVSLDGCRVIAASNPADTAADGGSLPAATANRWAHVDWSISPSSWVAGTLRGWDRPWKTAVQAEIASSVCAWITRNPAALLSVPTGPEAGRAWPSPRSWMALIRSVALAPAGARLAVAAGCVGSAASEWHTHHVARDLPDPEEVLAGRATVPSRGDRALATLLSVVSAATIDRPDRAARVSVAWSVLSGVRPDLALTPAASLLELSGEVPDCARDLGDRVMALRGGR